MGISREPAEGVGVAKQKPRHRGAGLGGSILCLAIPGSRGPSETQQAHHPNAQPLRWLRAARRTRMKKPRRSGAKSTMKAAEKRRKRGNPQRYNTTVGCAAHGKLAAVTNRKHD